MKKYLIVTLAIMFCLSGYSVVGAKTSSNSSLSSAIRMYKSGNYSQSYLILTDIVKKDPSNAVAYYYLAMTSAQIGKKDEAIENYGKVISLSPDSKVGIYAAKGKTCLETPDKCHEDSEASALDLFVQSKFGSGFSEEARSEFEKQKIENMMREMNRNNTIEPAKFKEYKDFSGAAPTNDEIVQALRVLQRAGLTDFVNKDYSELSLLMGGQDNTNAMLNMLMGSGKSNLSPQVIQSLITNQLTTGF